MKKLVYGALSVVLALGFTGCSSSNEKVALGENGKPVKFLNEAELKTLFTNKRIVGKSFKSDKEFDITFNDNGLFNGTVGSKSFNGRWYIDGNEKCMQYMSGKRMYKTL